MFGMNGTELIIVIVVALVVIGPQRMPEYAQRLKTLIRQLRDYANDARRAVSEDLGDEFTDIDWQKLDPRQYDPRRIVREALAEDPEPVEAAHRDETASKQTAVTSAKTPFDRFTEQSKLRQPSAGAPFDPEAT